jgi:hypothetical protein
MTINQESHSAKTIIMQNGLVALCALSTILLLWQLLKYSAYGFDFTDEGFYLLWIADPHKYSWPATQFGFIYHPIYSLLDGDIAAIRRVNILIIFLLAWALCHTFIAHIAPGLKDSKTSRLTISSGLATSALLLFDSSLFTPNYNSLNFQALLITAIGLVLSDNSAQRSSIVGWVLIGVGGWLAFMAKPSTALAMGLGAFFYFLLSGKFSIRMLLLSLVCAFTLLLLSALQFDGSVVGFIKRLHLGVEFSLLQDVRYKPSEMFRIDSFNLDKRVKIAFLLVLFTLLIAIFSSWKSRPLVSLLISAIFFSITALLTLGQINWTTEFGQFQGLLIFAVIGAMAISALLLGSLKALKTVSRQEWAIAAFFLIFPHIYAFGTYGNYWEQGSWVGIFWLLAGLTLLGPLIRARSIGPVLLPIAIAVQALTSTLLQTGLQKPYRQPQPLRLNSSVLEIGPQKSPLILSKDYSNYIANALSVAREAKFEVQTPMIDLTGQSPGILFGIGAQSIGQPWIIGGYPGSLKFAEAALAHTSCDKISLAWILFEPNGPRSIPTEVMLSVGADFFSAYEKVGVWPIPEGAGGYKDRGTQELYKPKNQKEILMSCQMMRQD